ncbi:MULTISPECIES: hypothetical protein [Agrobacterium]|uniref:hypothetical protein n=1 Tax=Agrobacterium tumefaciens TaxID=358 RepID=UPI0015723C9A|nr:hypothetical protein [Agrobacterium tumefaciens]NSZ06339.1 hypothetical protein [Agrobacterium tumefaciens]
MATEKKTVPNFAEALSPEKAAARRRRYELGYTQLETKELEAAIEIAKADPSRKRQAWEDMAERIDEINARLELDPPELFCLSYEVFSIIIDPAVYRDGADD